MALIVETGAIVEGANSYAAIADADAYHAERLNTAWATATEAQKTAALLAATVYLDGKYRSRWLGQRVTSLQPLEWPRYGVTVGVGYLVATTTIPDAIKHATCELALRALASPLAPDVAPSARVKRKRIEGAIDTEYVTGDFQTSYPVVDQLVSRYLRSGNDAVRG